VTDLAAPVLVAGVTTAAMLLLAGAFASRRYTLSRGIGTFDCSLRRETRHRTAGGWVLGVARYERDRLDWFRVFAVTLRPARSLARARLVILDREVPSGPEARALLPGWVLVRCAYGTLTLEFAMSAPAADGLAAWLESAPPGQHVNVP
jgi:Protein of unknown function (DUF2550)